MSPIQSSKNLTHGLKKMLSKSFSLKKLGLTLSFFVFYVGCSEVEFSSAPGPTCDSFNQEFNAEVCTQTADGYNQYNYTVETGRVEILFVVDNSGSMYEEQQKMGLRFPDFINSLSSLDYQIAIITTDVSASPNPYNSSGLNSTPRSANGHGAFQDGRFLKFSNGQDYISKSTPNIVSLFDDNITREETLGCPSNCPSGDERGIYALNLAFDRGHDSFYRKNSHLAVVILSDENERSNGGQISGYPLETYDLPETLVSKLNENFGVTKTMSVHSVITKPNDIACFNTQNSQGSVKGFYGTLYAQLSQPSNALKSLGSIVDGELGSICANDYGQQLGDIGSKITQNVSMVQLACQPVAGSLSVVYEPMPVQPLNPTVNAQNQLILDPAATAGTKVHVSYKCPISI